MAAETTIPCGPWGGKGFYTQLIEAVNQAVLLGVAAGTDTVTVLLANLANEQSKH